MGLFNSKSSNPLINEKAIDKAGSIDSLGGDQLITRENTGVTTITGAINKTLILFALLMVTTMFSYVMPSQMLMYIGMFGGIGALLVAMWKPHLAPIVAPIYALVEGLFVGSISAMYAAAFDGIVLQAITLTFGTLLSMLVLYRSGLIKVTAKFRAGVMMATGAIMFVYIISIIGHFTGFEVPFLHESGPLGIGISVVIIAVAAMNLLLDFDMFERAEKNRAPKYMEWLVGMGLLVTLVWLYIEFLRLLSKLQSD